jgi:hypothetical protein
MPAPLSVTFERIPQSLDAFCSMQASIAAVPQGGAAIIVAALTLYVEDEELGLQCLAAAVDKDRLVEGPGGYLGWKLRPRDQQLVKMQLGSNPHLPRSYFQGAAPENGYQLPPPPYVCRCAHNPTRGEADSDRFKAFVECSGASSPRPVAVQRNDQGLWLAHEWSSLLVGVQKPGQPMP